MKYHQWKIGIIAPLRPIRENGLRHPRVQGTKGDSHLHQGGRSPHLASLDVHHQRVPESAIANAHVPLHAGKSGLILTPWLPGDVARLPLLLVDLNTHLAGSLSILLDGLHLRYIQIDLRLRALIPDHHSTKTLVLPHSRTLRRAHRIITEGLLVESATIPPNDEIILPRQFLPVSRYGIALRRLGESRRHPMRSMKDAMAKVTTHGRPITWRIIR